MTLQEKIEILDGVKDHPNKEKLVFKIDGEWVPYHILQFRTLTGIGMKNFIERDPVVYMNQSAMNLFQEYLKQE